ncbi:hypothetical protein B5S28_g1074 [[Candida] boidinii]|nr:hypothetical protein B5S28_g1074 [[Candida] boidinii]OWB76906.1 hypothetical protein B5S32_g1063 [[Candida] boidinii]
MVKMYVYGAKKDGDLEEYSDDEYDGSQQDSENGDGKSLDVNNDQLWYGSLWPQSNFQKIDVLKVALLIKNGYDVKLQQDDHMKLPFEIILLILSFTENPVSITNLLICKATYYLLLPELYRSPYLHNKNFLTFVETIGASSRRKKFGNLVKRLDLSGIVQMGKNSFLSKLLRRFSSSLEEFVAPQTSFGLSPLVSLRSCHSLKILDLRLVSETMNLKELFLSIKNIPELEQLSFPRSSISSEEYDMDWPQKLWYLRLSGGISNEFLLNSKFPSTITTLEFAHCPNITGSSLVSVLMRIGMNLKSLSVVYPMPKLKEDSLDFAFAYCPNLLNFYVNVEYVSRDLFHEDLLPELEDQKRPLNCLTLDACGLLGQSFKIHPDDITIAIVENRLPCLKSVRISHLVGWDFKSDDVEDLVSGLDDIGGSLFTI